FDSPLPVTADGAILDAGGSTSSSSPRHEASSAAAAAVGVTKSSSSIGRSDSTATRRKRQRVPGAAGQQDLLMFGRVKPLPEGACAQPSGIEHLERDVALNHGAGSEDSRRASHRIAPASTSTTAAAAAAAAAAPSAPAVAPSAE
ncbi:unnamed protein product, partial [Laminaria digitata]